jgi:MarR family transcriptional regulator, 2-MHQ and catechol-resistance regulon repressor
MSLKDELGLQQPFRDIRHETVLNIVRTANLLSAAAAQLFRDFDLTEAQFNVLFALKFTTGDITQAELGKRLVVTRASITSVLDKLEAKDLVQRMDVPGNRRIHHVRLTPKGRALVDNVEPKYRDEIHRALNDWDESDCQAVIQRLEGVRERLRFLIEEDARA